MRTYQRILRFVKRGFDKPELRRPAARIFTALLQAGTRATAFGNRPKVCPKSRNGETGRPVFS